jgi:hypothetical protein
LTVKDLDRLVTKTEITPLSKRALRNVRHAVIAGTAGDAEVGHAKWSISMDTSLGVPLRMTFSFRRN